MELSFEELDLVAGGNKALDAISGAANVLGVVSFVAAVAASVPGPHSPVAGAIALGTGGAAVGLVIAGAAIGAATSQ